VRPSAGFQEANIRDPGPRLLARVLKWAAIAVAVFVLLVAGAAAYLRWFSPLDRNWVIKALANRYECDVELKDFNSSLFPAVVMSGKGLVLRRRNRPDLPPMATIGSFSVTASWIGLLRHPRHFGDVQLEGLTLNIPPRAAAKSSAGTSAEKKIEKKARHLPFVLDHVTADGTSLKIISANPDKPPRLFQIQKLRLQSAGAGPPMRFEAVLTNPRPVGEIQSTGRFGPWNPDDPSLTPVKGQYTFQHADLSTIRGLRGILSSTGTYDGVLSSINVHGETDTPDFALSVSGNSVDLRTRFDALVDGVNGDTFLRPVTAQLLSSTIVAKGGVARPAGRPGRTIMLDVNANPAKLQDLLRLAIKSSTPPITGNVRIEARLDLPPGDQDVTRRMKLEGDFHIDSARFTNQDTEGKIRKISRIGLGKHSDDDVQNAPLGMNGHFALADGVARFSRLDFSIPGANLQLHGSFGLESQALDFEGTANMQATASQMTTGVKSALLKIVDPLLSHNGAGVSVPIRITGTRESPVFHLEIGKILKRAH
jgi:AsmA-like C-terminal region